MIRHALLVAIVLTLPASVATAAVSVISQCDHVDIEIINEGAGSLSSGSLALDSSPIGLTSIDPGVAFESYLIRITNYDSPSLEYYEATFDIEGEVLGFQTDVASLRPGRRTLDDSGFDAGAPEGGIEGNDTVTLHGDLMVSGLVGGAGVDPIRVFVAAAAVPEVASAAIWSTMFVAGLVACGRVRESNE